MKVTAIWNVDVVPSSHFTAISDGSLIGFSRSSASMAVNWSASLAMGREESYSTRLDIEAARESALVSRNEAGDLKADLRVLLFVADQLSKPVIRSGSNQNN